MDTQTLGREDPKRVPKYLTRGLSSPWLETLPRPPSEELGEDIELKELKYIGSYNWVESENPTIIVPGSPRIWKVSETSINTLPGSEEQDTKSRKHYADENAFHMKSFILLPLIMAVQELDPGFGWPDVDFVANRACLREMLKWVEGKTDKWRIDTQLAGEKTILLSNRPRFVSGVDDPGNYGAYFEDQSTEPAPGLEDTSGHYRVVSYDFRGLKMVIRSEIDACLSHCDIPSAPPSSNPTTGRTETRKGPSSGSSSNDPIVKVIRHEASPVPQKDLVEIKTYSKKKDWADAYCQLYFSGTQHIYWAPHTGDSFGPVKRYTLEEGTDGKPSKGVKANAQRKFKQLRKLLDDIRSLVSKYKTKGSISLVYCDKTLYVYRRRQEKNCLPKDALALFNPHVEAP